MDNDGQEVQINKCCHCSNFISNSRSTVSRCSRCLNIAHSTCSTDKYCNTCLTLPDFVEYDSANDLNNYNTFNPYRHLSEDTNHFDFDDEADNYCATTATASNILEQCRVLSPSDINQRFTTSTSSPRSCIYYHNIDGFKSNFSEFLNQNLLFDNKFEMFCFAETNLKEGEPHDFVISSNYLAEHLYSIDNKAKGSGISMYFKKSFPFTRDISLDTRNECLEYMGGKVRTDFGIYYIITVYRFNNTSCESFITHVNHLLEKVADFPCIIVGDFNLNLFNAETNTNVSKYCESFFNYGFSPLISKATNVFRSSTTLIDQAWCNFVSSNFKSAVIDTSVSSHKPILLSVPANMTSIIEDDTSQSESYLAHNVSPNNLERFGNDFVPYYEHHMFNTPTSTTASPSAARSDFTSFVTSFKKIYDNNIVEKIKANSKRNYLYKPWITVGLAKSCTVKNRLGVRARRARGTPNEAIFKTEYTTYRSKLRDVQKAVKNDYFIRKFKDSKGSIKKCWKIVNEVRCKKSNFILPDHLTDKGQLIKDRRGICSIFNNYFTSVATDLNHSKYSRYTGVVPEFSSYLKATVPQTSIFLTPITSSEISIIIKELNANKSSDFSPRVLKLYNQLFSIILSDLLNNCMSQGVFPDELKIAKVLPLFKAGDMNTVSNYRPISILPIFSKIYEKLIHKRLNSFFEKHNILYEGQFGFRKGRSTNHALNTSVTNIINSISLKYKTMGIFVDFSKAFDTINHNILLKKLGYYGIRGVALDLMTDYLRNRKQYVYLDQTTFSELNIITTGVPQGSVLGPFLFIVYLNDIIYIQCDCQGPVCLNSDCKDKNLLILFADDCNTFISESSLEGVYKKANLFLERLKKYIDANFLHINLKKSKYVLFKPPKSKKGLEKDLQLSYDGTALEQVTSIRFLGVIIEETLSWSKQINHVISKVSQVNGVLYKLRKSAPKNILKCVYNSLVQSHLSFGVTIWGCGGDQVKLSRLFVAQKRAIRTVFGVRNINKFLRGHTKSVFTHNKILTIHNIYYLSVMTETCKLLCYPKPPALLAQHLQQSNINKNRLIAQKVVYSSLGNNYIYSAHRLWNAINSYSQFPKSFGTLQAFKGRVKGLLHTAQKSGGANDWIPQNLDLQTYLVVVKDSCQHLTT